MQFRDLDRSTPAGRQVIARLAAVHGEPLADAARSLDRLFLLGSEWAPGLVFVGGVTSAEALGPAGVFSVAGSADTLEEALAAAAGEAVERTALVERPGDIARRCSLGEAPLRDDERHLALACAPPETEVDLVRARDAITGEQRLVPADWCLRRAVVGPARVAGAPLSTGSAAGRSVDEAAAKALLELVERDAAALWWFAGRPARAIAADEPAVAPAIRKLGQYRRAASVRHTQLFDLTTDLEIPVVAAISADPAGRGFACGLGCRTTRSAAALAAVTELCQSEIGLQFAAAKRAQLGDGALSDTDRNHLARAEAIELARMPSYDAPVLPDPPFPDDAPMMTALSRQIASRDTTLVLVDLTRGPIPVVKAVAPGLHLYPSDMHMPRLVRARREFGGSLSWTHGCALF